MKFHNLTFLGQKPSFSCPFVGCVSKHQSPRLSHPVRFGSYLRACDQRRIHRFRCPHCKRTFSKQSLSPLYRSRLRTVHEPIRKLLCSGVSLRRTAILLRVSRGTVADRLKRLGHSARYEHQLLLKHLKKNGAISEIQFDELETLEHSKLKPLSVPLAVIAKNRVILSFAVCKMPSKGVLAEKSKEKYGPRKDERRQAIRQVLKEIKPLTNSETVIRSDSAPRYPGPIKRVLKAQHRQEISRKGCIVGQGELKKIGFDPLFSLNHSCAMLRANINRLFRKTWCTTKKAENLAHHIIIYVVYHNRWILKTSTADWAS